MPIWQKIYDNFCGRESFTLTEAYETLPEVKKEQIRARIYEKLGEKFTKLCRGVYLCNDAEEKVALIKGDGRNLDMLENESIDAIITDHPWSDKANKGGNRCFAAYDCFRYDFKDFVEKARVLKNEAFLVEFLPAENDANWEYLFAVKEMAAKAGLCYVTDITWVKGNFVANTGRKSKNTEHCLVFCKSQKPKSAESITYRLLPHDFSNVSSAVELIVSNSTTPSDMKQKGSCLSEGGFLIEFFPKEDALNFRTLYAIKKAAKESGLTYYSKVEAAKADVLIFSKGKARALRPDKKKDLADPSNRHFMSGTREMLPTDFIDYSVEQLLEYLINNCSAEGDSVINAINNESSKTFDKLCEELNRTVISVKPIREKPSLIQTAKERFYPERICVQPPNKKERLHQAEKPVELLKQLLLLFTKEGDLVLDQFAGSGVCGEACKMTNRFALLIERSEETCKKIIKRLGLQPKLTAVAV